jgi:hypothetical protein
LPFALSGSLTSPEAITVLVLRGWSHAVPDMLVHVVYLCVVSLRREREACR